MSVASKDGANPAPLNVAVIRAHFMGGEFRSPLIEVLPEVDSTNRYWLTHADRLESGSVCLAERQTGGRGRQGRHWVATPCANLMLSFAWRFEKDTAGLAGLSLAAGLGVLNALSAFGVVGVGLKWPN